MGVASLFGISRPSLRKAGQDDPECNDRPLNGVPRASAEGREGIGGTLGAKDTAGTGDTAGAEGIADADDTAGAESTAHKADCAERAKMMASIHIY
jgi:hypothetical protein